jgi:hypothetical protein
MRVVTTSKEKPVLERFAAGFHQDLKLMGMDSRQWGIELARLYTSSQRNELRAELGRLLDTHPGASTQGLLNSWRRLGATGWQKSDDLRLTIHTWIEDLK